MTRLWIIQWWLSDTPDSWIKQRWNTDSFELLEKELKLCILFRLDKHFATLYKREAEKCTRRELEKLIEMMKNALKEIEPQDSFYKFITELQNKCISVLNSKK